MVALAVSVARLNRLWRRAVCVVVLCAVGCAPAYNWREVAHEGVPLRALMPCKPERAQRPVPLLGSGREPVDLYMMSCQVDGDTFAVAVVTLPTPELADDALRRWRAATWASLKLSGSDGGGMPVGWSEQQVAWPGASVAVSWSGLGADHRGQPLEAQFWLGAQGAHVAQAAWYGKNAAPEVKETFFGALRFDVAGLTAR